MDKKMLNYEFDKPRSAAACIGAAWDLFLNNLKTIVCRLALPALAVGVCCSVGLTAFTPNKAVNDWGLSHPMLTIALMVLTVFATVGSMLWLVAATFSLLNGKRVTANLRRSLVAVGGYVLLAILLAGANVLCFKVVGMGLANQFADHADTGLALGALLYLLLYVVLGIAFLPYLYSSTKFLYDHTTPVKDLYVKDYARGWRHIGLLFLALLIAFIFMVLTPLVVGLPYGIIFGAQASNQLGMLGGDPSGTPSHLLGMLLVVSVVTWTFLALVSVWYFLVLAFLYGSIEARTQAAAKGTDH